MTTETFGFCTDPAVLEPLVTEVNGYAVLEAETDGNRLYVLVDRGRGEYLRYVVWGVWRTGEGRIAAESGDYHDDLLNAVVALRKRAGLAPS